LPRIVFETARMHLSDALSSFRVAVAGVDFKGKNRDFALTYRQLGTTIFLITIHPLKRGQLQNRLRSGRWQERN